MIRFDESAVPATSPADLDLELTRRFTRDDSTPTESSLRKLRIVADDDAGAARATVTGILLGTLEPQRWLPHAEIQAVAYAGQRRDVNYQIDARDIGGPLDRQVFEALHFVRRNARVHATKLIARVEQAQFSERAVFEALVNAVAHRDYSMAGARVRLHLFADRMELYVPGSLANTLTPESAVADASGVHCDQRGWAAVRAGASSVTDGMRLSIDAGNDIDGLTLDRTALYAPTRASITRRYRTADLDTAMSRALAEGAELVVVTYGGRGAVARDASGCYALGKPPEVDVVTSLHAGDTIQR